MRRSGLKNLIIFVVVVLGSVAGVLAAGWRPLLGLDLQGGIAVVLKPTTAADEDQINQAISIIRARVDAVGVSEPDITRQGGNVVVQLPGVKDQQRALDLVGTTAELRFRPVLQQLPTDAQIAAAEKSGATSTTVAGGGSSTTAPAASTTATTAATTTSAATSSSQQGLVVEGGGRLANGEFALARQETTTTAQPTTTTAAPATTATTATGSTDTTAPGSTDTTQPATATTLPASLSSLTLPISTREEDKADATVVLPQYDSKDKKLEIARYQLGPTMVTGDALSEARPALRPDDGSWYVALTFKDGDENVGAWRAAATACLAGGPTCPSGQLAVVLDGAVLSTPRVQSDFQGTNEATITGDFTEKEVRTLATALKYGSLPVEFERQQSQEVSATIGKDALRAGIASGIIGLAVVGIYILVYYRLLGLVALTSLALSFGLLWSIISWLGETQGLALSLAGVTGIIVSIGVSIDSNIVYFEQIKDDMATGRNLRSSSERAFRGAMSTIIKADLVSLIGAVLLYVLTVGPVRGFAFYLGLSTVLDLIASYFFMRPAVVWLSRTRLAAEKPKMFGIPQPNPLPASGATTSQVAG